ncbi:hypothetical protein SAMN05216316_1968 [Nitrosovibrio sp. Nv6]|nr:hypothetical protein SAMN05216316_1968 [Nitrosovibrio sp. Nv6]
MPETAMHEHHCSTARKNDVRTARKVGDMEAVAQACSMQAPSQKQFGFGVCAPDAGHHTRTSWRINHIRHGLLPLFFCAT